MKRQRRHVLVGYDIAQLEEQLFLEQLVIGSIPIINQKAKTASGRYESSLNHHSSENGGRLKLARQKFVCGMLHGEG